MEVRAPIAVVLIWSGLGPFQTANPPTAGVATPPTGFEPVASQVITLSALPIELRKHGPILCQSQTELVRESKEGAEAGPS